MTKTCTKCGETKPLDEFHRHSRMKDGRRPDCGACKNSAQKRQWHSQPTAVKYTRARARQLKHRYGVTVEQYEAMYRDQDGRCAICGKPHDVLCVDHDHSTLKVRGLLCDLCNTGIGKFGDSPELLSSAISYLTKG